MKIVKLLFILIGGVFFAAACGQAASNGNGSVNVNHTAPSTNNSVVQNKPATVLTPSVAQDNGDNASAKELYAVNCQICHKDTGKGGKATVEGKNLNVSDLTSEKMAKKSDDKLTEYIRDGVPDEGMPAFADKLKPEEIKSIVAHVRLLQKP